MVTNNYFTLKSIVVDVDTLASLDGVLWLRSGAIASKCLGQHQSTISRNINRCEAIFGINASKNNGEWHLKGDANLLKGTSKNTISPCVKATIAYNLNS